MAVTQRDEPWVSQFRKRLDEILELRRPQFRSVTDLGLQAGLSKSTLSNGLQKAHDARKEPEFDTPTLRALAGIARVSFSWLAGTGVRIDADDVPEPPKVSPLQVAQRRLGGPGSELATLRRRVKELERENAQLRLLEQPKK